MDKRAPSQVNYPGATPSRRLLAALLLLRICLHWTWRHPGDCSRASSI